MTVAAPPLSTPAQSADELATLEALEAQIEALFEEARRHARRRRRRSGAGVLLAVGLTAGLFFGFGHGHAGGTSVHAGQSPANGGAPSQGVSMHPVAPVLKNGSLTAVVSDRYRGGVYSI